MSKRAEQVDETRQRIVEATVRLHGTVGPAGTTIAGIADEARVTRLTVYRHFADEEALFVACSAHWRSRQPLPDPDAWALIEEPEERLRAGLADLYHYYRVGQAMLLRVYRDRAAMPEQARQGLDAERRQHRDVLLKPFVATGARRRRLRAVLGHATSYWTWRSLCVDGRLSDREAIDAMTTLALDASGDRATTME